MEDVSNPNHGLKTSDFYFLKDKSIAQLNAVIIAQHSNVSAYNELASDMLTLPAFSINNAAFTGQSSTNKIINIHIRQEKDCIVLHCNCKQPKNKLCSHQAAGLLQIIATDNYLLFFDHALRYEKLKKMAANYGMANQPDPDKYFEALLIDNRLIIRPKNQALLPVNAMSLQAMEQQLMLNDTIPPPVLAGNESTKRIIVLKQHKFYKHLVIELYDAATAKDGQIKNPMTAVAPLQLVMETNEPLELKFFTAVSRFQQNIDAKINKANLDGLKAIVQNPLNLDCYLHNSAVSEKVSAAALQQIMLRNVNQGIQLTVLSNGEFYEISGELHIGEARYPLHELEITLGYFIGLDSVFYLVKDLPMLGAINLFQSRKENLLIHQSQFAAFRSAILNKLEERMVVNYPQILKGTPAQIRQQHFDQNEQIIYLSDFGAHVMILPVMRYGEAEIPIRKDTQIYATDAKGAEFLVQRNDEAEKRFNELIVQQHPYFEEQRNDEIQYFYLQKKRFLDDDWFLNAFEAWDNAGIGILGFKQ